MPKSNVANKILDRLAGKSSPSKVNLDSDFIFNMYHNVCSCYSYINFEEFLKIPTPIMIKLSEKCGNHNNKWEYFRLVMLAFAGIKKPKY